MDAKFIAELEERAKQITTFVECPYDPATCTLIKQHEVENEGVLYERTMYRGPDGLRRTAFRAISGGSA